jgi:integrase
MNGHTLAKLQQHLNKGIKIRNMQCASFNEMIDKQYRDMPIEKLCKRFKRINPDTRMWDDHPPVSPDDSLLMNPFRANDKVMHFTVQTIDNWYKEVLSRCDLTDNFTIYSLRSTHITHSILRGVREGTSATSIKVLVADNCGTSEAELNRTYRRLNNLLNIDLLGFHQDSKLSIPVDVEYKDEDDSL